MDTPQLTADEMIARVLHRDGLMLVVDKPPGIPVHRGPKGGANLEASFDALRFGLPRPPVLAHRLDRDTSGCLVLGRHRKATATLGLLFKHGKISKTYWAVVEGGPQDDAGTIDMAIGRRNAERGWWQKPDPDGQPAATHWKVLGRGCLPGTESEFSPPPCGEGLPVTSPLAEEVEREAFGRGANTSAASGGHPPPRPSPARGEGAGEAATTTKSATAIRPLTWLALEPITGRTHQLRVHCAAMGWPIVGDNIYGNGPRTGEPSMHLHAREIAIPLSRNKPPVVVTAPPPPHMQARLRACGWVEKDHR